MMMRFSGVAVAGMLLLLLGCWAAAPVGAQTLSADDTLYVADRIYEDTPGYPCVRLAGSKGLVGCTSRRGGSVGLLWPVTTQQEVDSFLGGDGSDKGGLKMVVIPSRSLQPGWIPALMDSKFVSGVVLANNGPPAGGFSPDTLFPNKEYGLHSGSKYVWNPTADGSNFHGWNKPLYVTERHASASIIEKAMDNNKTRAWPMSAMEIDAFMEAAVDSKTCLRRGTCDPVGGRSVWGSLGPITKETPIILSIAGIDSAALAHDYAFGAEAEVSGTVALLAAIDALRNTPGINFEDYSRRIVVALFTGEAWGYTGSRRFVYDLLNYVCLPDQDCQKNPPPYSNISPSNIEAILEAKQVGRGSKFWLHAEKRNTNSPLLEVISQVAAVHGIPTGEAKNEQGLPPSSCMSFLREPNLNVIPTVVLTDHQFNYSNPYYHSVWDDIANIDTDTICKASTVLAQSLHSLAGPFLPSQPPLITVNCSLVEELAFCLADNSSCPLFASYFPFLDELPVDSKPPTTNYAGVFRFNAATMTTQIMAYFLAERLDPNRNPPSCSEDLKCPEVTEGTPYVCVRHRCINSTFVNFHDAYSPAFKPGWSVDAPDLNPWPEFTESRWSLLTARTYLTQSPGADAAVLVSGFGVAAASIALTWYLKRYLSKHYKLV